MEQNEVEQPERPDDALVRRVNGEIDALFIHADRPQTLIGRIGFGWPANWIPQIVRNMLAQEKAAAGSKVLGIDPACRGTERTVYHTYEGRILWEELAPFRVSTLLVQARRGRGTQKMRRKRNRFY